MQLGDQLITDDELALLELVKNSYDADADWAKIKVDGDYVSDSKTDFVPANVLGLIEITDIQFNENDGINPGPFSGSIDYFDLDTDKGFGLHSILMVSL